MSDCIDRFFAKAILDPEREQCTLSRFEIDQFVQFSYDKENYLQASAVDLSASGLRVQTEVEIDPGSRIFVMIRVPDAACVKHSISVECIVIHCVADGQKWIIGLRFHNMSTANRTLVDKLFQAL